jgi:hypothetical protein
MGEDKYRSQQVLAMASVHPATPIRNLPNPQFAAHLALDELQARVFTPRRNFIS